MPWITLKAIKNIRRAGELHVYYPGDSVQVGRQTALEWLLDGSAEDPYAQVGPPIIVPSSPGDPSEYGIRILAEEGSVALDDLGPYAESLPISYGLPELTHKYTCIWMPTKRITSIILSYGFLRVTQGDSAEEAWELAAMLKSLDRTAEDEGSKYEQALTLKVVGDLRFPVYDARLVWARKTKSATEVIQQWHDELDSGADLCHSFLRALYTQRAMLCTLPMDWTN